MAVFTEGKPPPPQTVDNSGTQTVIVINIFNDTKWHQEEILHTFKEKDECITSISSITWSELSKAEDRPPEKSLREKLAKSSLIQFQKIHTDVN